jgi:hypothetical protein
MVPYTKLTEMLVDGITQVKKLRLVFKKLTNDDFKNFIRHDSLTFMIKFLEGSKVKPYSGRIYNEKSQELIDLIV